MLQEIRRSKRLHEKASKSRAKQDASAAAKSPVTSVASSAVNDMESEKGSDVVSTSGDDELLLPTSTTITVATELNPAFPSLPLELVLEVLGHVTSRELLQLARTNKQLRHLLLNSNSATVWKIARSNIGYLPEPCSSLSEPTFASLLYDDVCHDCSAPRTDFIIWVLYKRACDKCLRKSNLYGYYSQLPATGIQNNGVLAFEVKHVMGAYSETLYSVSQFEELKDQLANLDPEDPFERSKWFRGCRSEKDARQQFAKECAMWNETQAVSSNVSFAYSEHFLSPRNMKRKQAIWDKLVLLGYDDVLRKFAQKKYDPLERLSPPVYGKQLLTDKEWNKISNRIIALMNSYRQAHAHEDHKNAIWQRTKLLRIVLQQYLDKLDFNHVGPEIADIANNQCFKTIVFDTPTTTLVTAKTFSAALLQIPQLTQAWRLKRDQVLLKLLPQGQNANKNILLLATTVFKCKACRSYITYPRILMHRCNTHYVPGEGTFDNDHREYFSNLGSWPFDLRNVIASDTASEIVEKVLELLGLNPETTTWDEVVSCNALLQVGDYATTAQNMLSLADMKNNQATLIKDPNTIQYLKEIELTLFKGYAASPETSSHTFKCKLCSAVLRKNALGEHSHSYDKPSLDPNDFIFPIDAPYCPILPSPQPKQS